MSRLGELTQRFEQDMLARSLGEYARAVAMSSDALGAMAFAQAHSASSQAQQFAKAAVTAADTLSGEPLMPRAATDAFIATAAPVSFFAGLASRGELRRLPLMTSAAAVVADASLYRVGQGRPIPVTSMSLSGRFLEPQKVAGIVIITKELLRASSVAGQEFLDNSLRLAAGAALDSAFVSIATNGIPPIAARGSDPSDALADLRAALDIVNAGRAGPFLWLIAPDAANRAATFAGTAGLTFPNLTPTGGTLLGLPAIVSPAVPAGTIILVDVGGFVGDIIGIEIDRNEHAAVEMSTTPSDPPNASTILTSMWQLNLVGLLVSAEFGLERIRESAVAVISSVEWT